MPSQEIIDGLWQAGGVLAFFAGLFLIIAGAGYLIRKWW